MANDEAQRRFLRRKAAEQRELERCCDCRGCDKCEGFVRDCKCDFDLSFLPWRKGRTEEKE